MPDTPSGKAKQAKDRLRTIDCESAEVVEQLKPFRSALANVVAPPDGGFGKRNGGLVHVRRTRSGSNQR